MASINKLKHCFKKSKRDRTFFHQPTFLDAPDRQYDLWSTGDLQKILGLWNDIVMEESSVIDDFVGKIIEQG